MTTRGIPDGLPVLSRGKHRSPRSGACFMEMASLLAGDRWSDRPTCTHPLLSQLARLVNDHTSDAGRARLVPMIPEVVGVHGHGFDWEVALVAAVACRAVPDVPEATQRSLAAGLLRCDELAANSGPHGGPGLVDREAIAQALDLVPGAVAWAHSFVDGTRPLKPHHFQRTSAPAMMLCSVRGTAEAAISDPDESLRDLLRIGLDTAHRPDQSIERRPAAYETGWRRRRSSVSRMP